MRQQSFAASATFAFVVLAAGAIGIGSVPAQARQNVDSEVQANSVGGSATSSGEKKICRTITRTGSNTRDRVCLSKEQWKRVDDYVAKSF